MRLRSALRDHGAAMVEFALVLPLFLMLVLGAVDWGWFFVVQDAVSNAAREGARAAVVSGTDGAARATTVLTSMLPSGQASRCSTLQTVVSNGVRVDATCPVGSLSGVTRIPPFTWVMPPPATARVEMRL